MRGAQGAGLGRAGRASSQRTAREGPHGRIEARRLDAFTLPERVLSFEHARQAMRVMRERTDLRTGETTTETVYAITSVTPDRASPEQLLAWNRGHWAVENANHYRRDASLGEDASRIRARHAPANNATLNNIALAIVFHRGFRHVPEANLHFMMRREDALDAILSPTVRRSRRSGGRGRSDWRSWPAPCLSEDIESDLGSSQVFEDADVGISGRTRPGAAVAEQLEDVMTQAHHEPLAVDGPHAAHGELSEPPSVLDSTVDGLDHGLAPRVQRSILRRVGSPAHPLAGVECIGRVAGARG